jgi:hypothetical protein
MLLVGTAVKDHGRLRTFTLLSDAVLYWVRSPGADRGALRLVAARQDGREIRGRTSRDRGLQGTGARDDVHDAANVNRSQSASYPRSSA